MNHGRVVTGAYNSAKDGVYLLISRKAVRAERPRCRVKMSKTHARQIRFSRIDIDSGGKAEKSKGWILTGFRGADFFRAGARFVVLADLVRVLEARGSAFAVLDCDFVFRVGIQAPLFRIIEDLMGRL